MWNILVTALSILVATVHADIRAEVLSSDNQTFSASSDWENDHETLARLLVQRLDSGGWAHGEWDMDGRKAGLRVQRVLAGIPWGPQRKKGEAPPRDYQQQHYEQGIVSSGEYQQQHQGGGGGQSGGGGVSETDLYLLSAIEKLAKRVERLERRLMRTEEALYLVHEGKPTQGQYGAVGGAGSLPPCREGFVRSGSRCYLFGRRPVDWKAANGECRKAGAVLAELETTEEGSSVLALIMARTDLKGAEYWTGGLNPGLIWIWSHGGSPVSSPLTADRIGSSQQGGGPSSVPVVGGTKGGRCLKMAFQPSSAIGYSYEGADCGARLRFICEDGGPDGEGPAGNALRRWERERRSD